MPKGFFTQGVSLLTNGNATLSELKRIVTVRDFGVVKEVAGDDRSPMGGASFVVAFRPEINGYISIDVVNERWPDGMGDPKTDVVTFGAWSMGFYGPFAYPGSLD